VDIAPHRWCSSEATSPSEAGDAQPKHEQGHES
jgi:hypothetical protein